MRAKVYMDLLRFAGVICEKPILSNCIYYAVMHHMHDNVQLYEVNIIDW